MINQVSVQVVNTGSMVAETDAEKVFDRFWRGDVARTADAKERRYGLGLALCKTTFERLGGTISAQSDLGGSFTVTVML